MTNSRIDFYKVSPEAVNAMMGLEKFVNNCGLDKLLLGLVKLRVSQINGCTFCVDLHSAEALKEGESQRRLNAVAVWYEAPFFTERERAALAWAEAVTLLSETRVPDEVYQEIRNHFSEKEAVDLTMAIVTINGWNRLAVSFRKLPLK
ncbi:carboxymuconolactone decarboxylase family protein [Legionella micdadei]|uniref:Alkylhydroperoxidase AhpD family core domain-containing protein n=1 Tax=Legionella micdadei TaxID=451 RepID=A0A098GJ32_LEGMI|nr:carboxymuconolactone decarboxylase family protein [Legionella micdadei]ARG97069.1 carboxymuconolactone decarboxylase family protein [Legionella micdadei]ARH00672.1 carboxymuconolactone decarboxylase family protein [Legionella micdadei]KTD26796.1 putative Carboxymuconolactone decarboxylase [Legionella micdadei]NSL18295.1 carboxymuconolactone decarboxylase family protein [Legionella micdadei]CEG61506.1 Alkylhydroperoxidase like protein, AhpD family [Legionella micdadei]